MKPLPLYLVALTAAFVVLNATGKIDWSWWQVTLPVLAGIVARGIGKFVDAAFQASEKKKAASRL